MPTRIKLLRKPELNEAVLITGLPGIGLVGKLAVDYLLKQFKPEKIAEVYSDSFPPSVHTEKGIIQMIRDELYLYEYKKKSYLFLAGPVQPSLDIRMASPSDHYEFAEKLALLMKELKVKKIYTLAGINIGDERLEREPKIIAAATSKEFLKELTKAGAKTDKQAGLISGAAGLLPGIAFQLGLEAACVMGETNAKLVYGDHGAAKIVLEYLVNLFGFKVDMRNIKKESANIEDAFAQLNKQLEEAKEADQECEDPLSYVR